MTHVVDSEIVQSLGNLDLLLSVEEGVGKLFTFPESTLDDLEAGDIAQEIGNADIVTIGVAGGVRVLAGLDSSEAGVVALRNISAESIAIVNRSHTI